MAAGGSGWAASREMVAGKDNRPATRAIAIWGKQLKTQPEM